MDDNWTVIVKEVEPYLDQIFVDKEGNEYRFFGVVYGVDDYYYGIWNRTKRELGLLSCVCNLRGWFETYDYEWAKVVRNDR